MESDCERGRATRSYLETTMKKHLGILTILATLAIGSLTSEPAFAACDSCVSHALPTTSATAYYAPAAPVVRTSYYAPTATAYTAYYQPRWWRRWRRAPRTTYYPSAVRTAYYPTTAYYARTAVAASGCSTCVSAPACRTCSYAPQVSYKTQIVNQPVTTMQPTTVVDGCTGCARTVMRPITTYVQKVQYVPTTVYRPVCSTGCAPACSTCAVSTPTCGPSCTGCASCAAGPATIQTTPAVPQQNVPTEADQKPELRMKPLPDKESDAAAEKAHEAKTRARDIPRLTDPNDRTARLERRPVRTASFEQTVPQAKKRVTNRQVGSGGWYSAK